MERDLEYFDEDEFLKSVGRSHVRLKNALVRDRIPELITADGRKVLVESKKDAVQVELVARFCDKILEEHRELIRSRGSESLIEELVDLTQLVEDMATALGISKEVAARKADKKVLRGGFEECIFMHAYEPKEEKEE